MRIEVNKHGTIAPEALKIASFDKTERVDERYANLSLDALSVVESSLINCEFRNITCQSVSFGGGQHQSILRDCRFINCNFVFSAIGNVKLENCSFESCTLEKLFGVHLELVNCAFPQSVIRKAAFHSELPPDSSVRSARKSNSFERNDFSSTELFDVDFRGGINLDAQHLPTGERYFYIRDTTKARDSVQILAGSLTDLRQQKRIKGFAALLDYYSSTGQRNQLIRLDSWGELANSIRDGLANE